MKKMLPKIIILIILILAIGIILNLVNSLKSSSDSASDSDAVSLETSKHKDDLFIPPILDYSTTQGVKNFKLNVQQGAHEFSSGKPSDTYGYNGNILGPTIRFSKGDKVNIRVNNLLPEQTTTHWHGTVVPGDADGGVHNIIKPNSSWDARFDVIQDAATLWYHPHQHEETARQVYMGLGGFIIIDDENSKKLPLPQNYGVDDLPLIVQSKNINKEGFLEPYRISHMTQMLGFKGNTLTVNGQIQPSFDVSTNLIRLRLLNGSSSEIYNFSLSSGQDFYIIASDGGFYNEPIQVNSVEISPAERREIIIDLSSESGKAIWLKAGDDNILKINISDKLNNKYELPSRLNSVTPPHDPLEIDRVFNLQLLMGGGPPRYGINGRVFSMQRVDFEVKSGTTEYWRVRNIAGGPSSFHPFHVHATQFQIVEFNGRKPSSLQEGLHDTILLKSGDEAVLAVPFDKSLKGLYMYHCHLLEHEDAGMMGQFNIIN